jgi:hypothetical protein
MHCNDYHPIFWWVLLSVFFFYGTTFSTIGLSSGLMQEKYRFSNTMAGFLIVRRLLKP